MKKLAPLCAIGCLAASIATPLAFGQTIHQWEASSGRLPTEQVPAWDLSIPGVCAAANQSLGPQTLVIDHSSFCATDSLSFARTFDGPLAGPPAVYWMEAECRILQSGQADSSRGVAGLALTPPGICPWILELDDGELLLSWALENVISIPFDTTSALRTYRLEVSSSTFDAQVFVDGQAVLSYPFFQGDCIANGNFIQIPTWGNMAPEEGGISEWSRVSHNLGDGSTLFCSDTQTPNSVGSVASISYIGSRSIAQNDFELFSAGLPPGTFGYYLSSRIYTAPTPFGTSQGLLCLGGPIGRFNQPGQILTASPGGQVSLNVDLAQLPQPNGAIAAQAGDAWHFQLWYRDNNPGSTSNVSGALQVVFE